MTILESDSVAVITGAALGIGRALSARAAAIEMTVVMIDLASSDFDQSVAQARACGGQVLPFCVSVADTDHLHSVARQVCTEHAAPTLLVNNAVTRIGGAALEDTSAWKQAFDVKLFGAVNGVDAFVPSMLSSPERSRIVNVGSKQGITNPPGKTIYNIAKSALKSYTELLQHDLRSRQPANVSAHLLVPDFTTTGHNQPNPAAWTAEQVVERLLLGLDDDDCDIVCPDNEVSETMDRKRVLWAATDVTENRVPFSRWSGLYDREFEQFEA